MTPEQRAINDLEWHQDQNWSWLGRYSSVADSRTWVPKRKPALGWTTNVAHTSGRVWLAAPLCVVLVMIALSIWRRT